MRVYREAVWNVDSVFCDCMTQCLFNEIFVWWGVAASDEFE